jgi:hypothetical protein
MFATPANAIQKTFSTALAPGAERPEFHTDFGLGWWVSPCTAAEFR